MKLKSHDRYYSFGPVKLYREEIDEIVSLVGKTCEEVELSTDKHVFDSLDEMAQRLGKQFHQLHITGRRPYISISLGTTYFMKWARRDKNNVYVGDAEAEAPFFHVKEMISPNERKFLRRFFSFPAYFLIVTIDLLFSVARHLYLHLSPGSALSLRVSQGMLYYGYLLFFGYFFFRGQSYITLKPRTADDSFLERNMDGVAKIFIGAVLGVFATLVGEWLKRHLFR